MTHQTLTSPIEYGPFKEETMLSAGLDYYKPTMSQFQHEYQPDAEVTFTFKNRGNQRLADYVAAEDLQDRLETIRQNGFAQEEIEYFRSLHSAKGERMFADEYLDYLQHNSLPEITVRHDRSTDDLAIESTGKWPLVTFWETIVMSQVSEMYFENCVSAQGLDIFDVYAEGDHRLSEKIAYLQANPDVKLADFGTRRRFSLRWQRHVDERLKNECPENFVGTSCVALAKELGLKAIGTFAHENPMVYAAIADAKGEDIRASHGKMLDDWYDFYGDELAIALSDTFGTDFFFEDFTLERAEKYQATRQDSGDPIKYGEKVLKFYTNMGLNPLDKSITFSDGLHLPDSVDNIKQEFKDQINKNFGVGTDLSNDLGLKAINQVMKATHVYVPEVNKGADTVKLSDDSSKHTGNNELVERYQQIFAVKEQ
ncbi:MAG: nicotinate phosphoribosyltransferase, nicotinate phosphoribosyltransferase [Candidatus Saccharibacteria bacterium]|nr:nicotinate phosphoribosyltransferase, nicotinate phosphoribosyltransferase [Candidatus Saccharibacteria bacterium]